MHHKTLIMTNSTISTNQVPEHFTSVTQGGVAAINTERTKSTTETPKAVQNREMIGKKSSENERMYWIEQKLSQRSYHSGYKGL
jgi:hypothetical protein